MRMKTQTTIRVDQENYLQAKEILKYLNDKGSKLE
jgi:sulfatase maturation enzyme AslB (radical SAM superfamily)